MVSSAKESVADRSAPPTGDARELIFGQGSARALPMKVIVCGLGRTGTASMQVALGILGIPTYHAFNLWQDSLEHIHLWDRAYDAKYNNTGAMLSRNDFDDILGNYMGVVDVPGAFFGAELAELYPDAKVVILNRDPETWFQSCRATFRRPQDRWRNLVLRRIVMFWDERVQALARNLDKKQSDVWRFEWADADAREKAIAFFHNYYAECRNRISEERRIEFKVQDGWGPLCEFLGVEVPSIVGEDGVRREVPFPRVNERGQLHRARQQRSAPWLRQARWDWITRIGLVAATGQTLFLTRLIWLPWTKRVWYAGAYLWHGIRGRQ